MTWRSLGTFLALAGVAFTLACGEEEGVLVGAELQGEWRYEMLDFTGAGVTCHAAPATAWAIKYRQTSEFVAYQFSMDSLFLDCTIPGKAPQHWLLREESVGPHGVAWMYLDFWRYQEAAPFGGCLLATATLGYVGDSAAARIHGISCSDPITRDGDRLAATRIISVRLPDTTGAPTYTLTGTARLFRP